MSIIVRIKKLERQTGINSKFCACGTSYFALNEADGSIIVNELCPDCKQAVEKLTWAELSRRTAKELTENALPEHWGNYTDKD